MFKKVLKRLLAVTAVAAICCTMGAPMTASALVCNHDTWFEGLTSDLISSGTHEFSYLCDVEIDGQKDTIIVVEECTIEVREYYYAKRFPTCSHEVRITEKGSWIVTTHSEVDNRYHTYE